MTKKDFLDFCNKTYNLCEKYTEENILDIFEEYDKTKINVYANIFNNLNRKDFIEFIKKHNIDNNKIINIYDNSRKNGTYMLKLYVY